MKFRVLSEAIEICRLAGVTPFIFGHRGVGKSCLVAQNCIGHRRGLIDFRCSQIEASDLRGLPDKIDGRTYYLPPADMPIGGLSWDKFIEKHNTLPKEEQEAYWNKMQPRLDEGILFLDEVNRAQDDVLQALFQLILDNRIGLYTLPMGWSVVCAGNFTEGYIVNGFTDPAFLDRFCILVLSDGEQTLEEWVSYMVEHHGTDASEVIEYATQNLKHLDGAIEGDLGFSIQPSRRSWDTVVRVDKICKKGGFSDAARIEVISGLVGRELAMEYSRYSCPVKPRDLIQHGVEKLHDKLVKLSRNEMTGLVWGLVGFVKPRVEEEKIGELCCDFAEFACKNSKDKDLVIAFCRALVSGSGVNGDDAVRAASISNPKLAKLLGKATGSTGKKKFLDHLNARPVLQSLLSRTAWGKDTVGDFEDEDKEKGKETKEDK